MHGKINRKDIIKYGESNCKLYHRFYVLRKCYIPLDLLYLLFQENDMETQLESCFENCWKKFPSPFELDEDLLPEEPNYFTAPFNRSRMDQ